MNCTYLLEVLPWPRFVVGEGESVLRCGFKVACDDDNKVEGGGFVEPWDGWWGKSDHVPSSCSQRRRFPPRHADKADHQQPLQNFSLDSIYNT